VMYLLVIPRVAKPKQVRLVQHPYWKNVTYQQAVEQLTGPDVRRGSIIIRPSTKGNNHLSITWKIDEGIYQHIGMHFTYFQLKGFNRTGKLTN
jgi:transcription elongation factor SPT6